MNTVSFKNRADGNFRGSVCKLYIPDIHNVHAARPHFSPRRPQFLAEFRVVLLKLDWTASKANDNCIHRAANETKQDVCYN